MRRLLDAGANITGAAAGAVYGEMTKDPITGAAFGAGLTGVASEFAHRLLSRREEVRVGAVIEYAASALAAYDVMGQPLRTDGFMQGDPSTWDEVVEGVLLSAQRQHEERKLKYLGNMLAAIGTMPILDGATANYMIEAGNRMTWLDMRVLAVFAQPDRFPMPDRPPDESPEMSWFEWTVIRSAADLKADVPGYLGFRREPPPTDGRIRHLNRDLSNLTLSSGGNLLVRCMVLNDIPRSDLQPVYEALIREGSNSEDVAPEDHAP